MIRYVPYVWRSVSRNRLRSILTVGGVAVGVLIVTWLAAVRDSRGTALDAASETTLVTGQKDST